jgi:hypothetical protein
LRARHSESSIDASHCALLTDPFGTFANSGILNTTPTIRNRPGQSYLLSYTWAISPNLINQAQVNTSWAAQRIPPAGDNWKRETYGFQFAKIYPNAGTYPNGIPQVNITNYAGMQGPLPCFRPQPTFRLPITLPGLKAITASKLAQSSSVIVSTRTAARTTQAQPASNPQRAPAKLQRQIPPVIPSQTRSSETSAAIPRPVQTPWDTSVSRNLKSSFRIRGGRIAN